MFFFLVFSIDENTIKVYNNKNIKFFCQNLVDIALKHDWYVGQTKKHYLILKITIMGHESYLLFITFSNSYPIINIG